MEEGQEGNKSFIRKGEIEETTQEYGGKMPTAAQRYITTFQPIGCTPNY